MNFYVILMAVYLSGELSYAHLSPEIKSKIKEYKVNGRRASWDNSMYRYYKEEVALIRLNYQKKKFETYAEITFTEDAPKKEEKGERIEKLWLKTKTVFDEYWKIKNDFEQERFCKAPLSDEICEKVFQHEFFQMQDLKYDDSNPSTRSGCVGAEFTLSIYQINKTYSMDFKTCLARKKEDDGTRFTVYLKTGYKQPATGNLKFFVLYKHIKNHESAQEEEVLLPSDEMEVQEKMESDPTNEIEENEMVSVSGLNDETEEKFDYSYEAYLTITLDGSTASQVRKDEAVKP